MAEVVLSNVLKRFRATGSSCDVGFTLGPFDFTLSDGKLTVLAGPSGCGKTTLLRLIAGLEKPSSGSMTIGGRPVDAVPPHQRNVAMVFQDHALYPNMTVRGNLAFPLKMRGVAKDVIEERIHETAGSLGIGNLMDRRPYQLSGGQQQRVALGRAIARRPEVLLLDEPLAHLDAQLRAEMRGLLVRLQRRFGLTVLHVTHDQAEATAMADLIAVLHDGRIEQVGTADELYELPSNRFVAGFFGSPAMNFVPGCIREEDGLGEFISAGGLRLLLGGRITSCLQKGEEGNIVLGVRPHDLLLADPPDRGTVARGRVVNLEKFDGNSLVRIEVGSDTLVAKWPGHASIALEEDVKFTIPAERVFVFDGAANGRLLYQPGGE